MRSRVARVLFVDDDAALASDERRVDDVDGRFGGGDGAGEALDEGGEKGFGVG